MFYPCTQHVWLSQQYLRHRLPQPRATAPLGWAHQGINSRSDAVSCLSPHRALLRGAHGQLFLIKQDRENIIERNNGRKYGQTVVIIIIVIIIETTPAIIYFLRRLVLACPGHILHCAHPVITKRVCLSVG